MNKTISINIAGFVFNIEEQAYEKLNHYLDAIKNNFKNEDDCDEIMEDIEARIAELFQEKLSDRKEVIIGTDVEAIIVVMGKPEEYLSDDEQPSQNQESATNNEQKQTTNSSFKSNKRLYRDESEGVIGGVCSGLGYYVGVDPVLIRIAFVLMTLFGAGILLYIILWVVMPNAKTTAEILEMKGESVTLDSIKEHVQDVKNSIVDNTKGAKKNIKRVVDKGVKAGSKLGYALSKIIGIGFVAWGLFALLILFIVLFGNSGVLPLSSGDNTINLSTLLSILYPEGRITFLLIVLILVTLIPVISIILVGVKLLLGVKTKFKKLSVVVLIIWFLSLGSFVLMSVELGMNFREHVELDYEVPMTHSPDILFVDIMEDDIFSEHIEANNIWNYTELVTVNTDDVYLGYPNLVITRKLDSSDIKITLHKESAGFSNKDAISKLEHISYNINVVNNELKLSPYFMINLKDKYRAQMITVEIELPIGKEIQFGNNIDRIFVDIDNNYYNHNTKYANTKWKVDAYNELRCVLCDENDRVYNYE